MFDVPNLDDLTICPNEMMQAADALSLLASYAHSKAMAMKLRIEGDVEAALSFERNGDATYKRLPQWAKW